MTEEQQREYDFLDTIDIWKIMYNNLSITDLMIKLEELYGDYIFNEISLDEFMDYLRKRYPTLYIREHTDYYIANKR